MYSGVACAILLLVIAYFPSKAPTPPSISSQEERMSVIEGLKNIIRDRYKFSSITEIKNDVQELLASNTLLWNITRFGSDVAEHNDNQSDKY